MSEIVRGVTNGSTVVIGKQACTGDMLSGCDDTK